MLDCLIAGDSIANIVGDFVPECRRAARGNINSARMNDLFPQALSADVVVIAIGTNDIGGLDNTRRELAVIRARVTARRVIWILPAIKPWVRGMVREIAGKYGDVVAEITSLQPDGFHPDGPACEKLRDVIRSQ